MSYCDDGMSVQCDGDGCGATMPVSIARRTSHPAPGARWLTEVRDTFVTHYCPTCSLRRALPRLFAVDPIPIDPFPWLP